MSTTPEHLLTDLCHSAIPTEEARAVMQLSLLDWAACAIAGQDEPVARTLRAAYANDSGPSRVVGGGMASAERAALINGTTSHALDYDDTHFAHIGHASVAVVPAAMAIAQVTHATGAAFADAALIGCEASVRAGLWLGRGHYQVGFHQTATAGAFGATLAAARLLGLNAAQTTAALGLAATRASGLKSQFGTMGKPYNAGLAAETGVASARLAQAGMSAPNAGLSGPQGFGETHHGAGDMSGFDDLGATWRFVEVSHKFHACCHGLHAMLEALEGQGAAEVSAIEVETHPRWLTVCNIAAPATGLEAKFSYAQTAAMRLLGYDTGAIASFSDAATCDPDIVSLREKVAVTGSENMPETASRVTLRRGVESQVLIHDLAAPQPLEQRRAKVQTKATALISDRAEAIWLALEAGDLDQLVAQLA